MLCHLILPPLPCGLVCIQTAGNHGDGEDSIIEPANAKNVIAGKLSYL